MDLAFPPSADGDVKPPHGPDGAPASAPVPVKAEAMHLAAHDPQPAHTSSHPPLPPDGPAAHSRQGSRGRTPRPDRVSSRARAAGSPAAQAQAQAPPPDDPNGRQLNVSDALTYLDAVKAQFSDQPDVYNRFLDIMKEFKTEQLDTPGVIHRVSTLFRGHPSLIQGFNTFLPAGYHIECSTDHASNNTITVTTPTGIHTTHPESSLPNLPHPAPQQDLPPAPSPIPSYLPPTAQYTAQGPHPGSPSSHANRGATVLSNMHSRDRDPKGEFSNAISFINKIKARYQHDQEIYKSFLEILQSYQMRQSKGIPEQSSSGIYHQVKTLLVDTPDLIEEFKQFLPDLIGDPMQTSDKSQDKPRRKPGPSSGMAAPPPPAAPKRKKRVEKEESLRPSPQKKPKHHHHKDPSPAFQADRAPAPAPIPPRQQQAPMAPLPAAAITAQQQMHGHQVTSNEELQFFDKVKRQFDDRATYDEFLKLLNLFSKDIIGVKTLVDRAKGFLGDTDLWAQFKVIVGYTDARAEPNQPLALTDRVRVVEDCGPSYRRLAPDQVALACSGRDELARSVLNDEWVSHPTWMSEDSVFQSHKKNQYEEALHRSEEERHEYDFHIEALTRTIALLEPIFQKILHMSDAERLAYKLPVGLGAASPSIHLRIMKKVYGREAGIEVAFALQESPGIAIPVVLPRLKQKDEEWRRARREWNKVWREIDVRNFYKSLDHQGITFKQNDKKTITAKHLVQQIEAARAESLRNARAVPQLVFRVEDEEVLKDAMKLVCSFLDRASTGAGALGTMYSPREARRVERLLRELVPLFLMADIAAFDAAFGAPPEGEEVVVNTLAEDDDPETGASTPGKKKRTGGSGTGSNSPRNGQGEDLAAGDLRKKLLTVQHQKAQGPGADDEAASTSGNTEGPDGGERQERGGKKRKSIAAPPPRPSRKRAGDDVWVRHRPDQSLVAASKPGDKADASRSRAKGKEKDLDADSAAEPSKRTTPSGRLPFFANSTYYTLFRLLQILYQRLHTCKAFASEIAANVNISHSANPMAIELGLNDPIYGMVGSLVSSSTVPSKGKSKSKTSSRAASAAPRSGTPAEDLMDVDKTGRRTPKKNAPAGADGISGNAAQYFYGHLLDSCEKLFEGDLDPLAFEENLRFMFGTRAYVMFTVDKVVAAIVKQLQIALQDNKCIDLLHMLRREREREKEIRRKYEEEGNTVRVSTSLVHERDLQDQIRYRRESEVVVGVDEHLFKICWTPSQQTLSFQLMKKQDKSFTVEDPPDAIGRWMQYTASYVMDHMTEDSVLRNSLNDSLITPTGDGDGDNDGGRGSEADTNPDDKIKRPFLKRNLVQDKAPRRKDGTGVEVRFCVTTYKMFFVANKGDAFWVQRSVSDLRAVEERVKARSEGCKLLQ